MDIKEYKKIDEINVHYKNNCKGTFYQITRFIKEGNDIYIKQNDNHKSATTLINFGNVDCIVIKYK